MLHRETLSQSHSKKIKGDINTEQCGSVACIEKGQEENMKPEQKLVSIRMYQCQLLGWTNVAWLCKMLLLAETGK